MNSEQLSRAAGSLIELALAEDLPHGDPSSEFLVPPDHRSCGTIVADEALVLCGLPLVDAVFQALDTNFPSGSLHRDGTRVSPGEPVWESTGSTQTLLQGERTALNFLQMLSGIATNTAAFVAEAKKGASGVRVCDTRKTHPGFRVLSKYAVRCGGGANHRFSLSEMPMLKDNHRVTHETIHEAVTAIRSKVSHTARIEVEADTLDQAREAAEAGADIILLDNMTPDEISRAVRELGDRVLLEASGEITLETIRAYAATGVPVISAGAITHSSPAAGFSLSIASIV